MAGERAERRGSGELESEILAVLWAAEVPLTPTEVQAVLPGALAYNTVHTILKRLFDKGLVVRDAEGRKGAYRPTRGAAQRTAELMRELLERGPDRFQVLQHFVTDLDPAEERALRRMLTGQPEGGAEGGAGASGVLP